MKVDIEYHPDGNTQGDFENGALTIHCSEPKDCFVLGQIFGQMVQDKKKIVRGENHGGVFVRVPLETK